MTVKELIIRLQQYEPECEVEMPDGMPVLDVNSYTGATFVNEQGDKYQNTVVVISD